MQLTIHLLTRCILAVAFAPGRVADLELARRHPPPLKLTTFCFADKGYQGLERLHKMTLTPCKKPQHRDLHPTEKRLNREIAKRRIPVEHVIGALKKFRILAGPYRNRRRRFGLRFNLIAGLFNHELSSP